MNLFRATLAPIAGGAPFFRAIVATGSHEASVTAVAEGRADLAAIDCVSFALLERGRPELIERVAVVAESPLSPGLPFIASDRLGAAAIVAVRQALLAALADPNLAGARAALGLKGARETSPADYDRVAEIERGAAAAGYARLE
jgi:ABC-type phosphate/phosphonate transport system substrate-binding protein